MTTTIFEAMATLAGYKGRTMMSDTRTLATIAREIRATWKKVNYAAEPYLAAMATLGQVGDFYYEDSAADIVRYFLSNASGWRGEDAKRIKSELKAML